jgi:rod shape determining protein RodA
MLLPVLLLLVTFVPVYLQPDLGTAGIIFLLFASFLFFLNLNKKIFYPLFAAGLCAMPFCLFFLREYQKKRLLVFLDPDLDPLRAGYQIIQSKIAVGSGGMLGKGFKMGTQSQLRFLPEQHTDFVFSVWAEEWGFVGCFVVLVLYFLLIYRALNIAYNAKNFYGAFLAIGISSLFFVQFFINICMTIGLFPVVGVPLPLMSYGGSAIVCSLIGVGLLLNVGMRKFK